MNINNFFDQTHKMEFRVKEKKSKPFPFDIFSLFEIYLLSIEKYKASATTVCF